MYSTPKVLGTRTTHTLNKVLFAKMASSKPQRTERTVRTGAIAGGENGRSGRECQDCVPLTGEPSFPSGSFYFPNIEHAKGREASDVTHKRCISR